MLKLSHLPVGLLALTIAAPVFAQPATTTTNPTPPAATMAPAKGSMVDINAASAAELKTLPGVTEADSAKIIQGRPYTDKSQLVSRHVVTEAMYDKIKDHLVAKPPRS
jgi:DNA uptake protein ComE-like DNA-binding protein